MQLTTVSIVLPIRNEEQYIAECLRSLLQQSYNAQPVEILVVDGRSSDRSREIVADFERQYPNVICIDNPAGIVPVGMNIGIRRACGQIIIRADGHNFYPKDYVANCVKYLNETGADNVGGPWLTVPAENSMGAHLVSAMLSNPFGVGDSRFRTTSADAFVETVPFGAYRRELFDEIGFFNEKLVRNQDNELNARIRKAGGKIYQAAALQTVYHPVASFKMLLKQTLTQSQWHVFSMKENTSSMGLRHFVPSFFLLALISLTTAALFSKFALIVLAVFLTLYFFAGYFLSFYKSRSHGFVVMSILPLGCFLFHLSYGLGTLLGLRYLFGAPSTSPIRAGRPVKSFRG